MVKVSETKEISEKELSQKRQARPSMAELLAGDKRWRLLVSLDGALKAHDLPKSGQVSIGRTDDNDIAIYHSSISRYHARLHLGRDIEIEDLDSTNGSWVGSTKLEANKPVTVSFDQPIDLAEVMVVLQQVSQPGRLRRLCSHDYFEMRLEEECLRSSSSGQPFAVMRLQVSRDVAEDYLGALLVSVLRPIDMLALYAPGEYELLLPDVDEGQIRNLGEGILKKLEGKNIQASLGVASYPQDGSNPEVLLEKACATIRGDRESTPTPEDVIVRDEAMERLYQLLERVAPGKLSILLLGETGSGKEILAESLHRLSPRRDEHFLRLNCAALSETLLESELFGHEKGAFTGALQMKKGLLESADGGTVFLDEIGEMPMGTQAKLLRVLESGEVMRVGSLEAKKINVRFVAATNRNLEEEIKKENFREDLYFRLNGMSFQIPPLRERPEEIEPLASMFIDKAAKELAMKKPPQLSAAALKLMKNYSWPGNIRELRNAMDRAVLLSEAGTIKPEHLPQEKMSGVLTSGLAGAAPGVAAKELGEKTGEFRMLDGEPTVPTQKHGEILNMEHQKILDALEQAAGNQTLAAEILEMPRSTFLKRLDAYGIVRPRKRRQKKS